MPKGKRHILTKDCRELRQKAFLLHCAGWTEADIAKNVGTAQSQVHRWVEAISMDLAARDFVKLVESIRGQHETLMRHVMQLSLERFEKSCQDAITVSTKTLPGGKVETTRTIKPQAGDPRFLGMMVEAAVEIMKTTGAYPAEKTEHAGTIEIDHKGAIRAVIVEEESWYGNNAHNRLAEAAPSPTADPPGSSQVQGSGLWPPVGKNGNGSANGHEGPR